MPAPTPVAKPSSIGAPGVHPAVHKPVVNKASYQANTGGADDMLDLQQHGNNVELPPMHESNILREKG